ncbi:MAG TPA: phospho-sugar mutase [Spirochaetota bacterium]|nr:phospho-sugar mutase [Spirochaetota bacterium]HPM34988.1 phospho-sugar mutase [Spirochaetota bacterium]HQQ23002.1 phospho-sugar mutase [Spirochaetota bacterium]
MESKILELAEKWSNAPFDDETRDEIKNLIDSKNEKELEDRFYRSLEFGTGGLRGIIGAGTNRMNIHTVGAATQGLANYIISQGKASMGVVVSYDSRIKSDIFSKDTASILAANGIKVYIFDDIMPTPLCSFAIRELKAVSGIMITASHNPPKYNGYKVYWNDGCQITPPHDTAIIKEAEKVDEITKVKRGNFDDFVKSGMIVLIGKDIQNKYIENLSKVVMNDDIDKNIKIVYTPLHGTGYKILPEVMKHFGFGNIILEPKQSIPDGNFPTVKYPNPEEKEALELAVKLAENENGDIILATDPDADRMGVGFKDKNGKYVLINGNQIGTMIEYYLLTRLKEKNALPKNGAVIKTIVTTELQSDIAKDFGCAIFDVLTGFKWIGTLMRKFDETGEYKFIFGGEESYGYLPVEFVRDKDAIGACYFFCEMAGWLKSKGRTLADFLEEIYAKYGYYLEDLVSMTFEGKEGMEKIQKIMAFFRNNPPKDFAGCDVERVDDIKNLSKKYIKTSKEEKISELPSSDVIQYFLSDGTKITMRPSGTEPKIKFYFSAKDKTAELSKQKIESYKKALVLIVEKI